MAKRSDILWRLCKWYTERQPNLSVEQLVDFFKATAQPIKRPRDEDTNSDAAKLWRMIQTEILHKKLEGGCSYMLWRELGKIKCEQGHISMAYADRSSKRVEKCQYILPDGTKCQEWATVYNGAKDAQQSSKPGSSDQD